MFPSPQQPPDNGGGDLEARLRGLILSNANTQSISNSADDAEIRSQLPPHMLSATSNEQQDYLATLGSPHRQNYDNPNTPPGRKRPNQAQRRQMNSQLSMGIDPGPGFGAQSPGVGPATGSGRPQWVRPPHSDSPQMQHGQRYPRHQPHFPRFQNHGPGNPFSSQPIFPHNSPRSPRHQHPRLEPRIAAQQGPSQYVQGQSNYAPRPSSQGRQLYQPEPYHGHGRGTSSSWGAEDIEAQISHLETCLQEIVPTVRLDPQELATKEAFRVVVENVCREAITGYETRELGNQKFDPSAVELQCFGSMMSGFATKGSDMDLALLSPESNPAPDSPDSPIPRLLEKKLLDMGFGARLLTRTRVPIIKLCQSPPENLRTDLLQERIKWENGFVGESEEEEEINEAGPGPKVALDEENGVVGSETNPTKVDERLKPVVESYEEKLASLKQKNQYSLGEYHNAAKRLLRRLGRQDVTLANSNEFDEEGLRILNDVCKAFISGLSSQPLISRLQSYPSISPLFNSSLAPIQRTLQGVMHQAEGERLAMAFDHRPLTEQNDKRELECSTIVEAWRALQNIGGPAMVAESLRYNRDLYIALERMKRIKSLQLVFFQQIPHEEPVYYYGRAQKLLGDLQGYNRNLQGSDDPITPIVAAQYLAGISSPEIREALQRSIRTTATLDRVALQHRVLQLAIDYDHALKSKIYDENDRPHIENYIAYLRRLDLTDSTKNVRQTLQTDDESKLIEKVRSLSGPGTPKSRDRYKDHLEFPKSDVGIQCDINFSAHLAIQNTLLLRCYSHCDPRVRPMILFIKHWAKTRGINTPYRGSLSSYGYVLMVLHYLVNVAQPLVCPNLQIVNKDPPSHLPSAEIEARSTCNGHDVRFWRNESEIKNLAERKMLNHNHDSLGLLLRGFFEYFAMNGSMTTVPHKCFDWGREVLSLRSQGGILSKQEKGWVGAKTVIETQTVVPPTVSTPKAPETDGTSSGEKNPRQAEEGPETKPPKSTHVKTVEEVKEVRHRYLFAIEDPFELDHNVARTVTHNGIVSIRDEFRRAWRIIRGIGKHGQTEGGLLDPINTAGGATKGSWQELLDLIHGPVPKAETAMG